MAVANNQKETERAKLHSTIWKIANDLRGSVDGWDFKQYVLGMLLYRFISENLTNYINTEELKDPNTPRSFNYANLSDDAAEFGRSETIKDKGFYILPSELFENVRIRARHDENLNETLSGIFRNIENSAKGAESESDIKGLFDDIDVNSNKLGSTVEKRNKLIVKLLNAVGDLSLGSYQDNTIDALALFGDKEAGGIVLLRPFKDYYDGYNDESKNVRGYKELVAELVDRFPIGGAIIGEQNQKEFIKLYGAILRVKNILTTFDEFTGQEILSPRDVQDYHSMYINLYNEFRKVGDGDKENVNDDIVFEMELIKQVEINIDYILELIRKYHEGNQQDKELLIDINKAIDSSVELRNKKDLIEQFITSLTVGTDVDGDWRNFVDKKKTEELDTIIAEEGLNKDETYAFIQNAFRDGMVQTSGTAVAKILPPVSRFSADNTRGKKRETVLDKLTSFFNKFFDISNGRLKD